MSSGTSKRGEKIDRVCRKVERGGEKRGNTDVNLCIKWIVDVYEARLYQKGEGGGELSRKSVQKCNGPGGRFRGGGEERA